MKLSPAHLFFVFLFVGQIAADKRLVCYWRRIIDGNSIPTNLCTHVIFTFFGIDESGELAAPSLDAQVDLAKLDGLRATTPNVKILICLGIVNEVQRARMATLIADQTASEVFSASVIRFFEQYNVDGIDVDFEFPAVDQVQTFVDFMAHLRSALGSKYLLTVAASTNEWRAGVSYNISAMTSQVDFVNLMTYDMQLYPWPETTGHQSPLFQGPNDKSNWNINYGLNLWVNRGAPREKLTIGIPTYGRAYRLADPMQNGIGAPATGSGLSSISYEDLCPKIKAGEWTEVWEDDQKVPYAFSGVDWAGHDNIRSVTVKANYLIDNDFGGAMFWSVDRDDPKNLCGDGSFPLTTTFRKVFFKDVDPGTTIDTATSQAGETTSKIVSTQADSDTNGDDSTFVPSTKQTVIQKAETTTSSAAFIRIDGLLTACGLAVLRLKNII